MGSPSSDSSSADETTVVDPPCPPAQPELPAGFPSGRYVVLERIGHGGMGTVERAYDLKLRRELALKRVRSSRVDADGPARLVREARSMAQLNHPNVVAVYDVEVDGRNVTIAMELVDGMTLSRWLAEERPWRETVDVLRQAGRGLAAAHRAGLVHRDFKPGNVLISNDGDVKVTDFGLAKPAIPTATADSRGDARVSSQVEVDLADDPLTEDGTVLGTPRYMAPEQHMQTETSAAADQYAFCLVLWEALTGSAPFSERVSELARAKRDGPPAWPKPPGVPDRIGAALRRGLAPVPSDRWPSLDALLHVLADDTGRRRTRWVLGISALGIAGLSWYGLGSTASEPCDGGDALLEETWNEARRNRAEAAMRATGLPYAARVWESTEAELDDYGRAWISSHRTACLDTIHDDQSNEAMDLRMACLRRARVALDNAVARFESANETVVENAARVARLPVLDRCHDVEGLRSESPPPAREDVAAAVEAAHATLAEARSLRAAGDARAAQTLLDTLPGALALEYGPFSVDYHIEAARVQAALGDWKRAAELQRVALRQALSGNLRRRAAEATKSLGFALGARLSRAEEGVMMGEFGVDMARSLGDSDAITDALISLGGTYYVHGRLADARAVLDEALRDGNVQYDRASVRMRLAMVLTAEGETGAAERELRLGLAEREEQLGAAHPDTALMRVALAFNLDNQGRHDEAEPLLRRAIDQLEAALGPDHIRGGQAHSNLGAVLHKLGRHGEANVEFERGIETLARGLGQDSVLLVGALAQHGTLLLEMKRIADARGVLERAWRIADEASLHGPDAATAAWRLAQVLDASDVEPERTRRLAAWAHAEIRDLDSAAAADVRAQIEEFLAG